MECTGRDKHNVLCRHLDQPLSSPLPFITQHRWRACAGAGRRRRHDKLENAVSAASALRRSPPADWPACGLGLVSVQYPFKCTRGSKQARMRSVQLSVEGDRRADSRRQAPCCANQQPAWGKANESRMETQQKGNGWKIRSFGFLIGRHDASCSESFPSSTFETPTAVGHDTRPLKHCSSTPLHYPLASAAPALKLCVMTRAQGASVS